MTKVTHRYKDKKLPPNVHFLDSDSGEIAPNSGNVFLRQSTGKINIDYDDYAYLNLDQLRRLISSKINQVEIGLLFSLCNNILKDENVCLQDNGLPHTTGSISLLIKNTPQATKKKLDKLIQMNLLNYSKTKVGLSHKKVFRVNPYLIKKGIKLNEQLIQVFNDITESSLLNEEKKDSVSEQIAILSKKITS